MGLEQTEEVFFYDVFECFDGAQKRKGIDSGAGFEGGREKIGHGKLCFQSFKLSRGFIQTSSNRENSDSERLAPAHKSHSFVITSEKKMKSKAIMSYL